MDQREIQTLALEPIFLDFMTFSYSEQKLDSDAVLLTIYKI